MLATIVTTVLSVLAGGAITLFVSRWYYRAASKDLVREAGRLREQNNLMLRALREFAASGNVEFNTDPKTGEPRGLYIKRSSTAHVGPIEGSAHAVVRRAEPEAPTEEPDDQQRG